MVGYNTEEYRLWFVPSGLVDRIGPLAFALARLKYRIGGRVARLYRAHRPGAKPGEVLGALVTDKVLRVPLNRLADERTSRTYMYEFAWRTPVQDLGACHALEIGFVFDTLRTADAVALAGPGAPQPLADAMHAAWVSFARTGDPGWPAWSGKRPVMRFDVEPELVYALLEDERAAW
ncbi:carboxylesterase family protein [Nonomuraea sp. NPDC050536]|uniref:carboxylesterase family protein n=1 Tax=Nonomuraea sp. NPDC050536 TaxID=3364366 RepID=UPI0037C5F199